MPESKSEQVRHSNEEITNFLACGDARGPAWLAVHPVDAERAGWTLRSRSAVVDNVMDAVMESGSARPPLA
jgi:hypothetical protein